MDLQQSKLKSVQDRKDFGGRTWMPRLHSPLLLPLPLVPFPSALDCGQPGFTISERKRFGAILKEGKLVDAYRHLHKEKDMDCGFSWSGNPIGKYRGKRMRIDYFLVSEKLQDRIVSCDIHGHGIELEGFYGSDHCPVTLELSPTTADLTEKEASD
ncbi:hypothetical protein KSS87_000466 [Heliosperma pusillum]|nr:hypothetical protein KSS87_000466 [Heliosperma pusillum]